MGKFADFQPAGFKKSCVQIYKKVSITHSEVEAFKFLEAFYAPTTYYTV